MSVQGEDILFRFGSSQTTVTMDSSDNHSNAHDNDEEGSHHPDENDNNDMDDLNPLPVDITFDNDDAMADAIPGVLDGTTTNTGSVDTGVNNQQGTNQSVASNNSNGVNDQSTNQSITSNHSNSVPMMMGVPVPGGSIGGGSYPAYPADNGDVDAWAAHMQRLLMAKDNEIRFLRQELASANQQLHILCPPPTSRNNIANVSIPGTVPVSVTTNGSMNGTYNNNTASGELDPITPRTQNPRQSSSSGNNRRSKKPKEERVKIENEIISDPYGDQGAYTGMILKVTRMPHGTGHMKYKGDNRVYDGQWRYGRWHGFGKAYFANGDTYVGDYNMDQRHGYGKYQWKDGRAYDGQFHEDSRHGEGIFAWPDGSAYVGTNTGVSLHACIACTMLWTFSHIFCLRECFVTGRTICEWSTRRAGHICLQ